MSTPNWWDIEPLGMTTPLPLYDLEKAQREMLYGDLGIPARIFQGKTEGSYFNTMVESNLAMGHEKFLSLREDFTKRIVRPLLEKQFPEWFWKPIFLCSPRGRLMVRREEPELPKITWDGGMNAG